MILCVLFIPPLYFMIRGKWVGFILSGLLYGFALLCILSIIGFVLGIFVWLLAAIHAAWNYRKDMAIAHAEMLATKMAEKMAQAKKSATIPPELQ